MFSRDSSASKLVESTSSGILVDLVPANGLVKPPAAFFFFLPLFGRTRLALSPTMLPRFLWASLLLLLLSVLSLVRASTIVSHWEGTS